MCELIRIVHSIQNCWLQFKRKMGTKLSIDKRVSELDDILKMNPTYFRRIRFESRCPQDIACHLKVTIKPNCSCGNFTSAISTKETLRVKQSISKPLKLLNSSSGPMNPTSFYWSTAGTMKVCPKKTNFLGLEVLDSLPNSMWALVESYANLTARGLEVPMASSESLHQINRVSYSIINFFSKWWILYKFQGIKPIPKMMIILLNTWSSSGMERNLEAY